MLSYILQVTICLFGFYLLYLALFSRETFFAVNRWYLLGTLALSLLLPLMPQAISTPPTNVVYTTTLEPVVIGIQDVSASISATPVEFPMINVLLFLYWLVAGILFVKFLTGIRSIFNIIRNRDAQQTYRGRKIIYSSETRVPFSFFHWIFLPANENHEENELEEILLHESAHSSALHSIDVLVIEILCILLWPSPLIYLYRKSLRRIHEYMADAAVLRETPLRKYGHLLLSQTASGMELALANHFFQSQLKQRIMMMTKNKSDRRSMLKYAAFIPVLLIVVALFAFRGINSSTSLEFPDTAITMDSVPEHAPIFKVVEEMPRFPGCEDNDLAFSEVEKCANKKLINYIATHIKYPEPAREAGAEGQSVFSFIVRADGSIDHPNILKSFGFGTDEVIIHAIQNMPEWIPGKHKGKVADVEMILPVKFLLPNDTESMDMGASTQGKPAIREFKVYPVPGNDRLNIEATLHGGGGNVFLELYSQNGELVRREVKNILDEKEYRFESTFNIQDVAPGTYIVHLRWNEASVSKSIVFN